MTIRPRPSIVVSAGPAKDDPTKLIRSQDGSKLLFHVLTVDGKVSQLPKVALDRRLGGKVDVNNSNVDLGALPEKSPEKK